MDWGRTTWPMILIWLYADVGCVTMTLICGERTYSPRTFSISRASTDGVLPTATMSSTSGVEILPSGRTGTVAVSSGLRQTNTWRVSPGPMMWSLVTLLSAGAMTPAAGAGAAGTAVGADA